MIVDKTKQFQQFLTRHKQIKDKEVHYVLRNALIEHLWEMYINNVSCSSNVLVQVNDVQNIM